MDPVLPILTTPALQAVIDADREWFLAHPARRYRLRPIAITELLPGGAMSPGEHVVVVTLGSPMVRLRLRVGRPPLRLRRDTDRCCAALVEALDRDGCTINGKPLLSLIEELRREMPGASPPARQPPQGGFDRQAGGRAGDTGDLGKVPAEAAPDRAGHLRVTLLDGDDVTASTYVPAGSLAELLNYVGRLPFDDRPLHEAAATPAAWARVRDSAFMTARSQDPKEKQSAALIGLWCLIHGPQGAYAWQRLAGAFAHAGGGAAITLRRDRETGAVDTLITEPVPPDTTPPGMEN